MNFYLASKKLSRCVMTSILHPSGSSNDPRTNSPPNMVWSFCTVNVSDFTIFLAYFGGGPLFEPPSSRVCADFDMFSPVLSQDTLLGLDRRFTLSLATADDK